MGINQPSHPSTSISTSDNDTITVMGYDLVKEIIGELSFTEMMYFLCCKRKPQQFEEKILNACLVTLMEHGINPSTIVTRIVSDSVPNEPQVAIAAGLLNVGGVFAGTSEQCAKMLIDLSSKVESEGIQSIRKFSEDLLSSKTPIAGFGHLHHKPDDPRSVKLFEVAKKAGGPKKFMDLILKLSSEIDQIKGKHITINATGAIAALMLDIGVPVDAIRSFSVVSRSAGLAAHLLEEKNNPTARAIWRESRKTVPYVNNKVGKL